MGISRWIGRKIESECMFTSPPWSKMSVRRLREIVQNHSGCPYLGMHVSPILTSRIRFLFRHRRTIWRSVLSLQGVHHCQAAEQKDTFRGEKNLHIHRVVNAKIWKEPVVKPIRFSAPNKVRVPAAGVDYCCKVSRSSKLVTARCPSLSLRSKIPSVAFYALKFPWKTENSSSAMPSVFPGWLKTASATRRTSSYLHCEIAHTWTSL